MKVVIAHYHLGTGGVSSIIERQIKALLLFLKPEDITLLSSTDPLFILPKGVHLLVDESLSYYSVLDKTKAEIAERIEAIKSVFTRFDSNTILHFHNPTLGKSLPVTAVLQELVVAGRRVVYHCHDFAEDRPAMMVEVKKWCSLFSIENYNSLLYPEGGTVSYIVINRADRKRAYLSNAIYLPNPVMRKKVTASRQLVAQALKISAEKQWFLYPVRAISRKNIGEILLLALLFPQAGEWLITLAPKNPAEMPQYEEWFTLAKKLNLPISCNVAEKVPFDDLLACCDRVVTTSVQEGFGLTYLEPWLVGKAVVGRRIPSVVSDFTAVGVQLDYLYDAIPVLNEAEEWCDFASLLQSEKLALVERLANEPAYYAKVFGANVKLQKLFASISPDIITHNCAIIKERFSLHSFSDRVHDLYSALEDKA